MKQEQIDQMRLDMKALHKRGSLETVAAVAGANYKRYRDIMSGRVDPTYAEWSTFNMLKGS